jgi:hypothetical protein
MCVCVRERERQRVGGGGAGFIQSKSSERGRRWMRRSKMRRRMMGLRRTRRGPEVVVLSK